jgi:glycosyltransferase involved in cell wall biosynthesis
MKLGIFYVTFNRPAILKNTIEKTLLQQRPPDTILIVDNANSSETASLAKQYSPRGVIYKSTGSNLGSAGGTAYGVRWLYEEGYDWICSGDDDNPPLANDTFVRLLRILENGSSDIGGAGVVGARWNWKQGALVRFDDAELNGVMDVDFIGGNHLLTVSRQVVSKVGTPEPQLFFGYPDLEYCLRIRRSGYRLLVDTDLMKQYRAQFGRTGLTVNPSPVPRRSIHAAWRDYYTIRNYIYMMRRTFERKDLANKAALKSLVKCCASWTRGPAYGFTSTRFHLRGIWDGYHDHLGKTVEPKAKQTSHPDNLQVSGKNS